MSAIPSLRQSKAATLSAVWFLLMIQGTVVPAWGQDPAAARPDDNADQARVVVFSDPIGQAVTLNGQVLDDATPLELMLYPGTHSLLVNAEGYQPLSHQLTVRAGQKLEANFILLETPPEPPTPADLRALTSADQWDAHGGISGSERDLANDSCLECHPLIPKIQAQGLHKSVSCRECHAPYEEHVQEGLVIAPMPVASGNGIQVLCLACHDRDDRSRKDVDAKTVEFPEHLSKKKVRTDHTCDQCHQVHAPMMWVHEAREIVGLPEVMTTAPLVNEIWAEEKRQKYNSMAETFLVFPLAPGVIGKMAFPDDEKFPIDEALYAGLVLVAGSYLMGKFAYSRELASIRQTNAERTLANQRAEAHNQAVAAAMTAHGEAVMVWGTRAEGRGEVVVRQQ